MARVTVEDCVEIVPNRFDLVLYAAQRAKQIASGNPLTIARDNDKDAVVSLREIAEKTVDVEQLDRDVTESFSRRSSMMDHTPSDEPNEVQETFAEDTESLPEELGSEEELPEGMSFADEDVQTDD